MCRDFSPQEAGFAYATSCRPFGRQILFTNPQRTGIFECSNCDVQAIPEVFYEQSPSYGADNKTSKCSCSSDVFRWDASRHLNWTYDWRTRVVLSPIARKSQVIVPLWPVSHSGILRPGTGITHRTSPFLSLDGANPLAQEA